MLKQLLCTSLSLTAVLAISVLPARSQAEGPSPFLESSFPLEEFAKQTVAPDSRVAQALSQANLAHTVDSSSGIYRVPVSLRVNDVRRQQVVLVLSSTNTIGSMEFRNVLSTAYVHNGPLPPDLARRLLQENGRRVVGSWRTLNLDQGRVAVVFGVEVEANASAERLQVAVATAAALADNLERELTNQDQR